MFPCCFMGWLQVNTPGCNHTATLSDPVAVPNLLVWSTWAFSRQARLLPLHSSACIYMITSSSSLFIVSGEAPGRGKCAPGTTRVMTALQKKAAFFRQRKRKERGWLRLRMAISFQTRRPGARPCTLPPKTPRKPTNSTQHNITQTHKPTKQHTTSNPQYQQTTNTP